MKKIRVIHVCDKFGVKGSSIHGVSRLFSWWMPRFDRKRFDVHLVGLRKEDPATENLKQQGIDVISLERGKFDFFTINDIARVTDQYQADILHLHGYGASNFGRMAAGGRKVKVILHEHFVDPSYPVYQIPFDCFLAGRIDYGIAVSNSVKTFMTEKRYVPEQKVEVVYNGAPLEDFNAASPERVLAEKKKWNIAENERIIASLGRIDEQKGNRYFIEAVPQILKAAENVRVMIAGDGPLLDALKEQCRQSGIEDRVIFTGYWSDVPLFLSMIDIHVIPSLWEGTPLTLFESMSIGKAIVSTNVDGLREVLTHNRNALIVPPRNPEKLADAVLELLHDPEKARQLGTEARQTSRQFDIRQTVNRLQEIYERMMA